MKRSRSLPQWKRGAALPLPAEQWSRWARAFRDRYGRLAAHRRALTMILVQPLAWLYWLGNRWANVAFTLCPQIHLAITRIFPQLFWTKFSTPRTSNSVLQFLEKALESRGRLSGNRASGTRRIGARLGDTSWSIPLTQFLAPVHGHVTVQSLPNCQLSQETLRILRHAVQERQRIEERVHRSMVVRKHRDDFMVEASRTAPRSVPMEDFVARSQSTVAALPPVNIEQFADQILRHIDYRFRAYRERMGKAF